MYISEIVIDVKNGNSARIDDLVEYYYSKILSDPKFENADDKKKKKTREFIEKIVEYYFTASLKQKFTIYMSHKVSRYIDPVNKKTRKISNPKDYYVDIIYNKLDDTTNILTKRQKLNLAKKMYSQYKKNYNKGSKTYYFSTYIQHVVDSIFSGDKNNSLEDKMLLNYVFWFGLTSKIKKYFLKKFSDIKKELELKEDTGDFDEFINDFLSRKKYYITPIITEMRKYLSKFVKKRKSMPKDVSNKDSAKEYCDYIKDIVKKKVKDQTDKESLEKIIDIKYDQLVDAYYEREHKATLQQYLNTALNNYISRVIAHLKESQIQVIIYAGKYVGSMPVDKLTKKLESRRQTAIYEFYINKKNKIREQFLNYLKRCLQEELNTIYLDEELTKMEFDNARKKRHPKEN